MQKMLFLCTGNYYRSRFSEDYINHHAALQNKAVCASSRGLHTPAEMRSNGNVGPMCRNAIALLDSLGVEAKSSERMPLSITEQDFVDWPTIYALDAKEHRAMMCERFPAFVESINYLHVPDLQFETFERAMPALIAALDELLLGFERC